MVLKLLREQRLRLTPRQPPRSIGDPEPLDLGHAARPEVCDVCCADCGAGATVGMHEVDGDLAADPRQGGIAFLSIAVGVIYALGLPLEARAPLHLLLAVLSVLFTLVNANHAGLPLLGEHPRVSKHGRHVGIVFAPFWLAASVLNVMAFLAGGA